ncbi:hypothetical protein Tco_0786323 [Tanacetum coccineum]
MVDSEEDSEKNIKENNEEDMEDGMETPAAPIKSTNCSYSGSRKASAAKKTVERGIVVIDLSDSEYDTENDEKEPTAKKAMVVVDQEAIAQKAIVTIKKEKDV